MEILKHISDTTTAGLVIGFLLLLAIYGTVSPKYHKIKHYAKQSPAILATVGIFFSFCGITYGLMGLDLSPEHIKDSIPNLLEGLKVKFIASLMGIGASIIVRVTQSFSVEEELAEINVDDKIIALLGDIHTVLSKNVDDSPESLLQELKKSIEQLPSEFKKQTTLLESIKSSLAGEGDASVTTQLGKLRSDMRDSLKDMDTSNKNRSDALNNTLTSNFDNLTQKFDEFARIVAENNSKAFIEALEAAMRDFNNNITEQFGENFKQLNQAVGELLKWQDNYKTHVEKLTENFEVTLKSVSVIQQAFTDIQTRSESFSNVSDELSVILQKLDAQLGDLNFHLKSLSQVAETAKDAFPTIEGNLEKLTLGFKKSTEQSLADINGTVESVGDDLKETISRLRDTTGKLRDSMEGQRETLETTSNEFKSTVDSTLKNLSRETQASIHSYQDSLQETVAAQLTAIDNNIKNSNALISNTILNASEVFGKSISETGESLKVSTDAVANHLTDASDSMKTIIETQQTTLSSASDDFKNVVSHTLTDLSRETQASIHNYQDSLQETVKAQLTAIDSNIQKSSNILNDSIDSMSRKLESTVGQTATTLEESTKKVASDLTDATSSMKNMMESQQETIVSTGTEFKNVVNQTLRDLSKDTQESIKNYQQSLQQIVTNQLNSIDDSIKETHLVVNKTIQNVGEEFENAIKNQSESMNKTISTAGESFKTVIQGTAKEFEVMAGTIAESINSQEKTLKNVSQELKDAVEKTLRELNEQSKASVNEYQIGLHSIVTNQSEFLNTAVTTASKEFNRLLAENTKTSTDHLQQQTQILDKALQEELQKSIEKMGSHLSTLSRRFVDDYTPLTLQLSKLVKMAEGIEERGR